MLESHEIHQGEEQPNGHITEILLKLSNPHNIYRDCDLKMQDLLWQMHFVELRKMKPRIWTIMV